MYLFPFCEYSKYFAFYKSGALQSTADIKRNVMINNPNFSIKEQTIMVEYKPGKAIKPKLRMQHFSTQNGKDNF